MTDRLTSRAETVLKATDRPTDRAETVLKGKVTDRLTNPEIALKATLHTVVAADVHKATDPAAEWIKTVKAAADVLLNREGLLAPETIKTNLLNRKNLKSRLINLIKTNNATVKI